MKRIPLDQATVEQLRAFADIQGLDYDRRVGADRLRAMISAVWDQPHIELTDDEPAAVQPAVAPKIATQNSDRVRIVIQHEESGVDPVFISHNGIAVAIRRGEEVEISREHFHALKLAVTALPIVNERGEVTGWRERPTFPYQVVA